MKPCALMLLFAVCHPVLADTPPTLQWQDKQGNPVSAQRAQQALAQCGVDKAADALANFTSGDLNALIEQYKAAVACFRLTGFEQHFPQ